MKKTLVFVPLALLSLVVLSWIALPSAVIESVLEASVNAPGLKMDMEPVTKKGIWAIDTARITFKDPQDRLLWEIDNVTGVLEWLSLLKLAPRVRLRGEMGGGPVTGYWEATWEENGLSVRGDGIDLARLTGLAQQGVRADGRLDWQLAYTGNRGELRFLIRDVRVGEWPGGTPLPWDQFRTIRGLIRTDGARTDIVSVTLEGKGVYLRGRGGITAGKWDVTLECMLDETGESAALSVWLSPYRQAPGYYVIPVSWPPR